MDVKNELLLLLKDGEDIVATLVMGPTGTGNLTSHKEAVTNLHPFRGSGKMQRSPPRTVQANGRPGTDSAVQDLARKSDACQQR